jgi:hypothetical protein
MRNALVKLVADYSIVPFLEARIAEVEPTDPDGAARCRHVIDEACDKVDITQHWMQHRRTVRGAVKDMDLLTRLAKNWANHPDFKPEWAEGSS